MRPMYYLPDGTPIENVLVWAKALQTCERRVDKTELDNDFVVSTVFLGMDHGYEPGPIKIYESMVFHKTTNGRDYDCDRYSTRSEAKKGHSDMVEKWKSKPNAIPSEDTYGHE